MSNMSYCRFRNTLTDLRDCYYALEEEDPITVEDEVTAKEELVALCRQIAEEFGGDK